MHVRGDSQCVVGWLKENDQLKATDLLCWKERIKFLKEHFQHSFPHVHRELNCRMDALSKRGLQEVKGSITVKKIQDNELLWRGRFSGPSNHRLLPL